MRDIIRYLLGRRARFLVSGYSMFPTLKPNVSVFVETQTKGEVGDIIVLEVHERVVIKRLHAKSIRGVWVLGDNPIQSTDSRDFGWVPEDKVIGKVCSFW